MTVFMIAHVRLGKILLNKIAAVIVWPKLGTIIQTSDVVMLIMPQLQFYESEYRCKTSIRSSTFL